MRVGAGPEPPEPVCHCSLFTIVGYIPVWCPSQGSNCTTGRGPRLAWCTGRTWRWCRDQQARVSGHESVQRSSHGIQPLVRSPFVGVDIHDMLVRNSTDRHSKTRGVVQVRQIYSILFSPVSTKPFRTTKKRQDSKRGLNTVPTHAMRRWPPLKHPESGTDYLRRNSSSCDTRFAPPGAPRKTFSSCSS